MSMSAHPTTEAIVKNCCIRRDEHVNECEAVVLHVHSSDNRRYRLKVLYEEL